jgi:hypothetical protein
LNVGPKLLPFSDAYHKQDADAGLILRAAQVQVLLKTAQASQRDGIPIKIIQPVHGPQPGSKSDEKATEFSQHSID